VLGGIIAGNSSCNDRRVYVITIIGRCPPGLCVELDRGIGGVILYYRKCERKAELCPKMEARA